MDKYVVVFEGDNKYNMAVIFNDDEEVYPMNYSNAKTLYNEMLEYFPLWKYNIYKLTRVEE